MKQSKHILHSASEDESISVECTVEPIGSADTHSSSIWGHALLGASLVFGVSGQLLLKFAMLHMQAHPDGWLLYFWVFCGLGVYAIGTVCWVLCLAYLDLSYAYPFTGLTYIAMLGAAWFFFGDQLSLQRVVGVLVICLGVMLIPTRFRRPS
jgi:drug/metabolite transporter (DMT)-like permease